MFKTFRSTRALTSLLLIVSFFSSSVASAASAPPVSILFKRQGRQFIRSEKIQHNGKEYYRFADCSLNTFASLPTVIARLDGKDRVSAVCENIAAIEVKEFERMSECGNFRENVTDWVAGLGIAGETVVGLFLAARAMMGSDRAGKNVGGGALAVIALTIAAVSKVMYEMEEAARPYAEEYLTAKNFILVDGTRLDWITSLNRSFEGSWYPTCEAEKGTFIRINTGRNFAYDLPAGSAIRKELARQGKDSLTIKLSDFIPESDVIEF